jgi:hypothetical protein
VITVILLSPQPLDAGSLGLLADNFQPENLFQSMDAGWRSALPLKGWGSVRFAWLLPPRGT